jgi:hypothetical protein
MKIRFCPILGVCINCVEHLGSAKGRIQPRQHSVWGLPEYDCGVLNHYTVTFTDD